MMTPDTAFPILVTTDFLLPLALLSSALPRRHGFLWRAILAVVIFGLISTVVFYYMGPWVNPIVTSRTEEEIAASILIQVAAFSSLVLLLMGIVSFCHESNLWTEVFCAAAAYSAQNLISGVSVFMDYVSLLGAKGLNDSPSPALALVSLAVIPCFYLLFVRPIRRQGLTLVEDRTALLLLAVVIFFNIAFDIASKSLIAYDVPLTYVLIISFAHLAVCLLVLYLEYELLFNRRLQVEAAATERLMSDREQQYQMSRETIDAINMKCHDIRHQIRHFPGNGANVDPAILADIAREVDVYDSKVQTGNEGMDTILSEKRLLCEGKGIELDCVADGSALEFLSNAELYSLFGNLLDNAIEAVERLDDQTKRIVSLSVRTAAGMATIHEENYFDEDVRMKDGTPVSTKGDSLNHGYGFRSMRTIVESHSGVITCGTNEQVFFVDAVIPQPA